MLPKLLDLTKCFGSISLKIALGTLLACAAAAGAQTVERPVSDRVLRPIDDTARVSLSHTVHPLANRANDRGAVADGLKLVRLQIILKRSDAQEADLKELIAEMHTPGRANYHKWLTPEEFGKRFGPSEPDVGKLTAWLQSHGFSVTQLNAGRQTLEFSGSAGQFRDTFKAQIHSFQVQGEEGLETHYANAADPQVPVALAPVFGGFASLNNFRFKRNSRRLGTARYDPATHASRPDWTAGAASDVNLVLSPADFAVQYAMPSQKVAGTGDGAGQSIAIVNEANINVSVVDRFRTLFGLPVNPPRVIIDGNDPGIDGINNSDGENDASGEAYLDVEWAGAVAPAATINLVIAADTALANGLALAAQWAVYSNISPIISLSFSECEARLQSGNDFFSGLWEQAAAQGITVVVSTGDSGSAGCDASEQAYALDGQAVNGIASTPYNVAVGGTDFYYAGDASQYGTYWGLTSTDAAPAISLMKRVPEQAWNDSQYGTDVLSYFGRTGNTTIIAGAGGASTLGLATTSKDTASNSTTTYGPYPKPSWQNGTGVPADSARDIPDVSLFASDGANNSFYPICEKDEDCQPAASGGEVQITGVGGTSASTPAFAGIMALVDQQYGRQGQAGFVLYPLAAQYPAAFNDVTVGTNTVPCAVGSTDCQTVGSSFMGVDSTYGPASEGEVGLSAGNAAYNAGPGYDLATGLGSVNVSTLLSDWGKVTFAATTVTLTPSSTTFMHGTAVPISGMVTGTGTPTGDVALMTDSTTQTQAGQTNFALSGGSYSGPVGVLPGGTYDIWANYGGDSANASSTSIGSKVQVTVTPEPSKTSLYLSSGYDGSGKPVAPASVLYGTQVLLGAQTAASSGQYTDSVPTGSVAFSDAGAGLNTALVNAQGGADYNVAFGPGSHTFQAAYSGDASYGGSTSATATLMVMADTPTFLGPSYSNLNFDRTALLPGQQALIIAVANADSSGHPASSVNAAAPAGTLTMTGGPDGSTALATLVPAVDRSTGAAEGVGTFIIPASASGTYNLTFTYTPTNATYYNGIVGTIQAEFSASAPGLLASTTTATATPTAATPAGAVQVTSTIAGPSGQPAPTGTITFYSSETLYGSFALPTGAGNSTTVTAFFDSKGLIEGTNQISVQYSGDTNYLPSVGTVNVANSLSDFQMVPLTTILSVGTSGTATGTINLASTNSFTGAVTFTCSGAGGVRCSLDPAAATLAAGGQASVTLTVNSAPVTRTGTYNVVVTGSDATGNYVHTLGFEVVVTEVTVAGGGTIAVSAPAITIASQGASGTSTVTVTPTVTPNGVFNGSVALTCAVTSAPAGATDLPTCVVTPSPVTLSGVTPATSTLTVNLTAQTTGRLKMLFPIGGGVTMAALFLMGGPMGRRGRLTLKAVRTMRLFSAAALFGLIAAAATGCGSGSSPTGGATTTGRTAAGAYTVTLTATPAAGAVVTATVAVTVD